MNSLKTSAKMKALYALEYGNKINNPGIVEDAEKILSYIGSKDYDAHDLIRMAAYQTIVRVWMK